VSGPESSQRGGWGALSAGGCPFLFVAFRLWGGGLSLGVSGASRVIQLFTGSPWSLDPGRCAGGEGGCAGFFWVLGAPGAIECPRWVLRGGVIAGRLAFRGLFGLRGIAFFPAEDL